jgi:predicted O-methyltransferase YrrM
LQKQSRILPAIDMTIHEIINNLHQSQTIETENGRLPLHSSITADEGVFIESLIISHSCKSTIEIGCAYGISSLHISRALQSKMQEGAHHTIIDPFQHTQWQGIGIKHLQQAAVSNYTFIEKSSEQALPQLLEYGKQYDFALIDGWHTFDQVMLDFYYLNRMLKVGGVIVFDDMWMPSVRKALAYILQYPAYRVEDALTYANIKQSIFSKLLKNVLYGSIKNSSLLQKVLPERLVATAKHRFDLYGMMAIQKVSKDERGWDWFPKY